MVLDVQGKGMSVDGWQRSIKGVDPMAIGLTIPLLSVG